MAGFTEEEKASLKELKELHDGGLIDDEALKQLREPIFLKLLTRQTAAPARPKGTPESAQLLEKSANKPGLDAVAFSDLRSSPNALSSSSSSNTKTVHVTATIKPEVRGKKRKTTHDSGKGKLSSLFNFAFTSTRKMADGSSMLITDDDNAFIPENYEPDLECDVCGRKFSWVPALTQHKKSHKEAVPKGSGKQQQTTEVKMVTESRVRLQLAPDVATASDSGCRVKLTWITAETLRPETNQERLERLKISPESEQQMAASRKRRLEAREAEDAEAEMEMETDSELEVDTNVKSWYGRRGSDKRSARSFYFKRKVLVKLREYEQSGVSHPFKMTAVKFGVAASCITKWRQKEEYIMSQSKRRKSQSLSKKQQWRCKGK